MIRSMGASDSALTPGIPEEVGMDAHQLDKTRALIRDQVESGRSPTIAAVVSRRGKIVLQEAHGVQRPGGPPLTIDHMFPVASITKPFTAAVVMALVERGEIGLMQRIIDYLPDFDDGSLDDVLVHHLLTHTSGWDTPQFANRDAARLYAEAGAKVDTSARPPDRDAFDYLNVERLKWIPRARPAGELLIYHTYSYDLLAEIIRRATGTTLHQSMTNFLFEPLGLKRSAVIVDGEFRDHAVERDPLLPFGSAETSEINIGFQGDDWWMMDSGGTGLQASPLDVLIFSQMIINGGSYGGKRVLSAASVRAMTSNQIPGTPSRFGPIQIPESPWGYGFMINSSRTMSYFGGALTRPGSVIHPGAGGMTFWIDIEQELTAVYFECITEVSPLGQPVSSRGNRFTDMVMAAVTD